MDKPKEFQILVRRKIPYISEGLWNIVAVLVLIILLLYVLMLPTKFASNEMATAYYILVVPEGLKRLSTIAFIGLIVFIPLYFAARLKKLALLVLNNDTIFIKGKNLDLTIPFENIKKNYFNDLKNLLSQPKDKMQIVIQQKSNRLTIFLLANYDDVELAFETLSKINNAEFAFYDNNMATMHDEDE